MKYRQPGYRDQDYKEEREKTRKEDRGPRGPREPRGMAREARLVTRCYQCGPQEPALESVPTDALCPKCRAAQHCCRHCVHFDPGARPQALENIRSLASVIVIVSLLAGQTGCLSTSVPPVGAEGPAFKPTSDERRLWDQAREEERKLRDKATLYQDPILEDYLNQVADRLAPPEVKGQEAIRIRVFAIKDPTLNAFTYPTASIYVHTELLARLENEAQLAVVLGHEMTHATHRHALEFERSARNKVIGFSIASIAASIWVAGKAGAKAEQGDWRDAYMVNQIGNILVGLGLQLAFIAAVNGFGRELERGAGGGGLGRAGGARDRPRHGPPALAV